MFGWLGVKEKSIQMDLDHERNDNIAKKCRDRAIFRRDLAYFLSLHFSALHLQGRVYSWQHPLSGSLDAISEP